MNWNQYNTIMLIIDYVLSILQVCVKDPAHSWSRRMAAAAHSWSGRMAAVAAGLQQQV